MFSKEGLKRFQITRWVGGLKNGGRGNLFAQQRLLLSLLFIVQCLPSLACAPLRNINKIIVRESFFLPVSRILFVFHTNKANPSLFFSNFSHFYLFLDWQMGAAGSWCVARIFPSSSRLCRISSRKFSNDIRLFFFFFPYFFRQLEVATSDLLLQSPRKINSTVRVFHHTCLQYANRVILFTVLFVINPDHAIWIPNS